MMKSNNDITMKLPTTSKEAIEQLIPHRDPMVMVDGLIRFSEGKAETTLTILNNNCFVENGVFTEMGLIEHMAQSAALYSGYKNLSHNKATKEGFIASIKNFELEQLPFTSETINTKVEITYEMELMLMVKCTSFVNNKCIATIEMSTVIKN